MNFAVAKVLFNLIAGVGWILLLGGGYLILSGNNPGMGIVGGAGLVAMGAVTIAVATMGLAQIQTAENTAELARLISQGASPQGQVRKSPSHDASSSGIMSMKLPEENVLKTYKGHRIIKTASGVSVDGDLFSGVLAAEKYIDSLVARE